MTPLPPVDGPPLLTVRRLGRIAYYPALQLQRQLATRVQQQPGEAYLLLLEHDPVLTLGRRGRPANILVPPERLALEGISVVETDRGGDVTYHGPGQVVAYPILDMRTIHKSVKTWVRGLEEVMIRTCAAFGVKAFKKNCLIGVWTDAGKIGAIGVHISRHVSTHGLAFNVSPDPAHFAMIHPCGLVGEPVARLTDLVPDGVTVPAAMDVIEQEFRKVFAFQPEPRARAGSEASRN